MTPRLYKILHARKSVTTDETLEALLKYRLDSWILDYRCWNRSGDYVGHMLTYISTRNDLIISCLLNNRLPAFVTKQAILVFLEKLADTYKGARPHSRLIRRVFLKHIAPKVPGLRNFDHWEIP